MLTEIFGVALHRARPGRAAVPPVRPGPKAAAHLAEAGPAPEPRILA